MLRRERELRLSQEIQDLCDECVIADDRIGLYEIFEKLQKQVVQEFGFVDNNMDDGVNFLQSAATQYPNDSEISNIAYYIKYNRASPGNLKVGDVIPNIELHTLDKKFTRLNDYYQQVCQLQQLNSTRLDKERALVILSGSITWSPFVAAVEACQQRVSQYQQKASFVAIYIQEAHSRDEWPCGKVLSFCNQHKSLEDRLELAVKLISNQKNQSIPFLMDNINNDYQTIFAAWPFRFYIIYQNKIALKGEPNNKTFLYDLNHIDQWIMSHL